MHKTEQEWRAILAPEAFRVTRQAGTEPPFSGAYWNCKESGVYTCICCASPLFASATKYDSKTGWPSFYQPINSEALVEKQDHSMFMRRTEVCCARCDAHLGHVFPDGSQPTGLRYCINSAALNLDRQEKKKPSESDVAKE